MSHRGPYLLRLPALGLVAALVGLALTACTSKSHPPEPEPTAAALAAGLSALDVSGVAFSDTSAASAQAELSRTVAGMKHIRPVVRVEGIRAGDHADSRTAGLTVSWDLDGRPGTDWTYATAAALSRADDAWRVSWSPAVLEPSLEPGERLVLRRRTASRGRILGSGGAVLVTQRAVLRLGIDKTRVPTARTGSSARSLATLLDIDPERYAATVRAGGQKAFVVALVLRADDPALPDPERLAGIPGAVALKDELDLAPTRDFARPVLGAVGEATAELVAASAGRLEPGDSTGLSGLQQRYDEQLAGRPGLEVVAQPPAVAPSAAATADPGGPPAEEPSDPRVLVERKPVVGTDLVTTLDPALQTLADATLARVAPASAIVAIRPSTGAVLAAASGPGGNGYSTALLGRYAPGSTFKVVTSLALLRAGLTASTPVTCSERLLVNGKEFTNYDDYPAGALGTIPLRSALAHSCNTAFISRGADAPQQALHDAGAALGLGVDVDLGLPAFLGAVPAQAGATEQAASMIGQGKVLASPLAMATVAASVAAGHRVTPVLLVDRPPADAGHPSTAGLTASESAQLRALMRAVVTQGSGRFLQDLPGGPVAAKTGTAEYGTRVPLPTHAWMIALQDDLAVAVFVDDGESGSQTAGPLLERFLRGAR